MTNKKEPIKTNNDSKEKLELANRIAKQSQKVSKTYASVEGVLFKFLRFVSSLIDRILFNPKYTLFVSLGIALLLYVSLNYSSDNPLLNSGVINSEKTLYNVQVHAKYNSETFELVDLPKTMDVSLVGTASNVTSAVNKTGRVEANLEGYTEGTHKVKVIAEGYGSNVDARPSISEITVTLKKKITRQFDIGYDFTNTDKIDSKYVLGKPVFDTSKVNVRASQDTLDSIAFVKALIDVTGKETNFEQEAVLVAYDKTGYPVQADISPSSIKVTVDVTTPSKSVPIQLETTGEVPEGMAIESILMDNQSVTIYAPDSVLSKVDKVTVQLDASILNKDTKLFLPVILPTGVNNASISKVNLEITLQQGVTKVIDGVSLTYRNNVGKFKDIVASLTSVQVEIFGTQSNVDKVTADDLIAYFDMTDAEAGVTKDFQLHVETTSKAYIRVRPVTPSVSVTIPEAAEE